jgi:hypothetical protein
MESKAHLERLLPVLRVAAVVADHRHSQHQVEILVRLGLTAVVRVFGEFWGNIIQYSAEKQSLLNASLVFLQVLS